MLELSTDLPVEKHRRSWRSKFQRCCLRSWTATCNWIKYQKSEFSCGKPVLSQGTVAVLFSLAATTSFLFWCTELSYLKLQQELLRLVQLAWFSFNSWHLRNVYIRIRQKKNPETKHVRLFISTLFTQRWEGGIGHVPCMCKMLCFPKESWLVLWSNLTLLSGAGLTLSLSPSKNGVSHRSPKLLNGPQSQLMSASFLYSSGYHLEPPVLLQ